MAQFEPFDKKVEVNGQAILSVVNASPMFRDTMLGILEKHGIQNLTPEGWYSQTNYLNAFQEIANSFGENTLLLIGKAIPDNAKFPPDIDNLEKALASINVAYQMNHRNGEIGSYSLTKFDENKKIAVMECHNPYPSSLDQGIITAFARKFIPRNASKITVALDDTQPNRLAGANQCTFIISW